MRNTKRIILSILIAFMCMCMIACTRDRQPELADGKFIKLSSATLGLAEDTELYTTNIEVYQDGTVVIYADNFDTWLSDEECPVTTTMITTEEVDELKRLIKEEDLYNLREDVGDKFTDDGSETCLTLFTVEGEHSSGGVNPSNRRYLRIYDYIYELVREETYTYKLSIAAMQEEGSYYLNNSGIMLTDNQDNVLIDYEKIDSFSMVAVDEDNYNVVILLTPEGSEQINSFTVDCDKSPEILLLYLDGVYKEAISIDYNIIDGVIYFNETYTKEQAEAMVQELSTGLE